MPDIASVLKSEIARLARKEVRAQLAALKKATAGQRSEIAALKREVKALQAQLKGAVRTRRSEAPQREATGDARPLRFSAGRLAAQRKKLGLSAQAFGQLVGVTGQSIYKWETGGARPRRSQLEAIAALRSIGKREAQARLAAQSGQ
jgi:DNA-binding transcriptional regulator YiaG